jgi:hypothetical protein
MAFVAPALAVSACSSHLHGSPVCTASAPSVRVAASVRAPMEMKKARFHQPLRPSRPEQMKVPEDGTPIFSIFVRSPRSKIWFPLGSVAGDDRSKTLVSALKSGWGKALYQNSLDKGIAQTVYGQGEKRFLETALRQYPQLKKSEKVLEFGYKVAALDLEDAPTRIVTRDQALPFLQWAKKVWNDAFAAADKRDAAAAQEKKLEEEREAKKAKKAAAKADKETTM